MIKFTDQIQAILNLAEETESTPEPIEQENTQESTEVSEQENTQETSEQEQEEVSSDDSNSEDAHEPVEEQETEEEANFVQEEAYPAPESSRNKKVDLSKPIIGAISTEKMVHGGMVFNDVCTSCVRCGMHLTDAVSIERGMGPECSSKGYAEDPKDPDEMQAMIVLAGYPVLVDFLVEHYKPLGVRGLMNGLVRIACLNRKSRVHDVCTDAIELLGYKKLAATLRDSLASIVIKDSKNHPEHLHVRVLRRVWTYGWSDDCKRHIPNCFYDKEEKGLIVSSRLETKRALWNCLMRHYSGECAKTSKGTIRIPTVEEWENKDFRKNFHA